MAEHRRSPRRRTLKGGTILFGPGEVAMDCVIRNISETGASLQVEIYVGIPDNFTLLVKLHEAELRRSRKYPLLAEALNRLRATSAVLDGEAVCFTNGMHDFDKLWSNCFDDAVRLCAFDLLEITGRIIGRSPWQSAKSDSRATWIVN